MGRLGRTHMDRSQCWPWNFAILASFLQCVFLLFAIHTANCACDRSWRGTRIDGGRVNSGGAYVESGKAGISVGRRRPSCRSNDTHVYTCGYSNRWNKPGWKEDQNLVSAGPVGRIRGATFHISRARSGLQKSFGDYRFGSTRGLRAHTRTDSSSSRQSHWPGRGAIRGFFCAHSVWTSSSAPDESKGMDTTTRWHIPGTRCARAAILRGMVCMLEGISCSPLHAQVCGVGTECGQESCFDGLLGGILREDSAPQRRVSGSMAPHRSSRRQMSIRDVREIPTPVGQSGSRWKTSNGAGLRWLHTVDRSFLFCCAKWHILGRICHQTGSKLHCSRRKAYDRRPCQCSEYPRCCQRSLGQLSPQQQLLQILLFLGILRLRGMESLVLQRREEETGRRPTLLGHHQPQQTERELPTRKLREACIHTMRTVQKFATSLPRAH